MNQWFSCILLRMSEPAKILVVQPSWVGDAVMATPTLRALRELYPRAEISYLLRRYVKPIYSGMPWWDRLIRRRLLLRPFGARILVSVLVTWD